MIQFGKQSNQPINLANCNTFYQRQNSITFMFTNGKTQVWQFVSYAEALTVYHTILKQECKVCQ